MKRWLVALTLVVIVWPVYLYMNIVDQNRITLDNLQSEMNQFDTTLQDGISSLADLGDSLMQTDNRIIDMVIPMTQTLNLSVLNSCGIITNGWGHGSCVAIRPNLMLTAGHCIGMEGAWIEIDGQQYRILKQWKSERYDVGFVEVEGDLPFVELAGRDPELLDEVFLIGSPYDVRFDRTITKGVISHLERHIYDHVGLIQTDAEGAPGSSGCPLFCKQGRIIGICVAGPNPGGGVVLCEPVEHIRQALSQFEEENDRQKSLYQM